MGMNVPRLSLSFREMVAAVGREQITDKRKIGDADSSESP
jgi:hypothetical protein